MNLNKLFTAAIAVVIAYSSAGKLDVLQTWIWRAQAKLIYEARTETWGSPRFFPRESDRAEAKTQVSKAKPDQF